MKLTRNHIQLLAGIIIAISLSALTTFAAPTKDSSNKSIHVSNHASMEHTFSITSLASRQSLPSFHEDHSALRSNHFNMPGPILYAIATPTRYSPAIRRARIRRKGNLHG
jgi:hypothetical protein